MITWWNRNFYLNAHLPSYSKKVVLKPDVRCYSQAFNIPELLCNHGCVGVGWRVEGQKLRLLESRPWMPRCMQNKADARTIAPWEFHQTQEVLKMLYIQGAPWSNGGGGRCIIIKFTWKSLRYQSKRILFTWQSQSLKTSWRKRHKNLMVSPLEYNDYIS